MCEDCINIYTVLTEQCYFRRTNIQWLLEAIVLMCKSSPFLKIDFKAAAGRSRFLHVVFLSISLVICCFFFLFVFFNVVYSRVGPLAGEHRVSWNLSGQFITPFLPFKAKTQTVMKAGSLEKAAQPLLAFISVWVRLHNPPLTGVWAFLPQLLTTQTVFVSVLWHFLHTNTHRDSCQKFAHTPAEMQINSWIDKKPARWNAKTIWVDMSRTCLCFSSLSLPALQ